MTLESQISSATKMAANDTHTKDAADFKISDENSTIPLIEKISINTLKKTIQNELQNYLNIKLDSKLDEKFSEILTKLDHNVKSTTRETKDELFLQVKLYFDGKLEKQNERIDTVESTNLDVLNKIDKLNEENRKLQKNLGEVNDELAAMKFAIKKVSLNQNSLEQHSRRWAMRINGIAAPSTPFEETSTTREIVVLFLRDRLGLEICCDDIDTAHRLGSVYNGNQTILFRLIKRYFVDQIIKRRRNLVGQHFSVMEDITQMNVELLNKIKVHKDLLKSYWFNRGKVCGITHDLVRVHFEPYDDIVEKIDEARKEKKEKQAAYALRNAQSIDNPKPVHIAKENVATTGVKQVEEKTKEAS